MNQGSFITLISSYYAVRRIHREQHDDWRPGGGATKKNLGEAAELKFPEYRGSQAGLELMTRVTVAISSKGD